MWRATKITADAASKMQMNSGLLLNRFDISNPVAPLDADIICDTTGDYNITCQPETQDFFEDVKLSGKIAAAKDEKRNATKGMTFWYRIHRKLFLHCKKVLERSNAK